MEYKRLGDYIRLVDVRNRDLKVTKPMGINIDKYFMPSVANVIGTDLSVYKLVSKNQFACNLMHVGRDEKIPMAMLTDDNPIIVSPAYLVFEITQPKVLMPEYLMMWFSRSEFDRNAWFYTDGDVRGGMDKEAFMDMQLPIPSITCQREIVSEYQTVEQRIQNNEQLIKKLEETAQAIYNHTFVEGINEENLPKGWEVTTMAQICDFAYGKMPKEEEVVDNGIPVYCGYAVTKYYKYASHTKKTIVVIARGDAGSGEVKMSPNEFFLSNLGIAIMPKDENLKWYLYYHLLTKDTYSLRTGSAQAQVTINSIEPFEVIIPPQDKIMYFSNIVESLSKYKDNLLSENSHLNSLLSLLTSKLS